MKEVIILMLRYGLDIYDLLKYIIDHPDSKLNEYRKNKAEVLSQVIGEILQILTYEEEDNCERSESI